MTPDDSRAPDTAATASDSVPRAEPRVRRWPWIAAALGLALIVAGAWYWWPTGTSLQAQAGRGRPDQTGRPLPVVAAEAKKGSIDVYLNGLGTVTPRNMVVVRSRVDGQLVRIAFREGNTVKAGDVLAQIDPRPFEVQLTLANGQLARDQALLENARVDVKRYRTLLEQDSISKQQVDTQESLVRQYEAALQADQGKIDNAKLQLTYTRVMAPIGGRVGLRQVDPGNIVHASDATGLVVITQLSPIAVVFPIPEDALPRVMKRLEGGRSHSVDAFDRAQKEKLGTGRLLTADNQIDTATGTVKLKAEVREHGRHALRESVRQRAHAGRDPARRDARADGGHPARRPGHVRLRREGRSTVAVTPAVVGTTQGETTSIDSGVAPGAMVVVDGADRLREGAKVEVVTRDAPATGAGGGAPRQARRQGRRPSRAGRGTAEGQRRRIAGSRAFREVPRESVAPVHPPAGGDIAADGRDPARRHRRVPCAAGVRAAASSTIRRSRSSRCTRARARM